MTAAQKEKIPLNLPGLKCNPVLRIILKLQNCKKAAVIPTKSLSFHRFYYFCLSKLT
jgi:hypothetical protein